MSYRQTLRLSRLGFAKSFRRQAFLAVYPSSIEQVRPELNGLFRVEDDPSSEKLRRQVRVKLEVLPIPSGEDFRGTLFEEEKARVEQKIDASVRPSLQRATEDLWDAVEGRRCAQGRAAQRAGIALPRVAGD